MQAYIGAHLVAGNAHRITGSVTYLSVKKKGGEKINLMCLLTTCIAETDNCILYSYMYCQSFIKLFYLLNCSIYVHPLKMSQLVHV